MSEKLRHLFCFFLLVETYSCKTLNNNMDNVALICKQEAKRDEIFLYATREGTIITQGVQFQLFDRQGRHDLPVTRGGCVSVKKSDGLVKVLSDEHYGLLSLRELNPAQKNLINIPTQIADRETFLKCGSLVDSFKLKNIMMLKLDSSSRNAPNPVEFGWRFLGGQVEPLVVGPSECEAVPSGSEGYFIYKALSGYYLQSFNSNLLESVTSLAYSENEVAFCALPDVRIFLSEFTGSLSICDQKVAPTFLDYCESKVFESSSKRALIKAVLADLKLNHCPSVEEQSNFKQLSLKGLKIENLDLLLAFTGLTTLKALKMGLQNIDAVVQMTNLVELELGSNQLVSLPDFKDLTRLTTLDLADNRLMNLEGLRQVKSLIRLDIGDNKISDFSPLSANKDLEYLFAKNNKISSIHFISNHPQLYNLWLSNNQIVDLSPLRSLTNIQRLFIDGNKGINDLAPLSNLPLQVLSANDLPIKDFGFLRGLVDLNILELTGSCGDLSTLPRLPSLKWFVARGCSYSNLEPLRQMQQITQIDMQDNAISDLTPIKELKLLDTLWLSGNPVELNKTSVNCPKNAASLVLKEFCEDSN